MFETKGQPLKWSVKYEDLEDKNKAEVLAELLNHHFESKEGRELFEKHIRETLENLMKGTVISEGTA